ncbi:MAG: carotenoid biosynthesis protein [Verrucomicrobiota bacterium]
MIRPPDEPRPLKMLQLVFLIWTVVGLAVMATGVGPETIRNHLDDGLLRRALLAIDRGSDAIWMVLAALTAGWLTARFYGWKKALYPASVIAIGSSVAEAIGATTGFPFGPYHYSDAFGLRIAGILPFTIPLAWYAVVAGSLGCARYFFKGATTRVHLLISATFATLTDFNLEEVAWKIRGYWEWYPDHPEGDPIPALPPVSNFVSWFLLAFLFSWVLTRYERGQPDRKTDLKRLTILLLMNGVFIAARLGASGR